jgi:multicomponent Na+:H+ antiporter subunit E
MSPYGLVRRIGALVALAAWACVAVVRASLMVARDVIAPSARVVPGVVIVPLRARTPVEVAVVSGLVILTPGTMTVTIRPETHEIWVHGMYAADPEALRAEVLDLERRVLRALREGGAAA